EAWTYNLDSSTLDEGSVSMSAQATDAVGTTGSTATQNFIVDRTPPTVTLSQNGVLRPTRNTAGRWIVSLDGTATDPNAGAEPGSGVAGVEVLVQADAPLAGNGWQSANVTADSWSLDYRLPPLEVANP